MALSVDETKRILGAAEAIPVKMDMVALLFITKGWAVVRQDEHGNVCGVKDELTESEADALVEQLEARGHKQTYTKVRGA